MDPPAQFAEGSPEAIGRVASGESELALVDINELIRSRDKAGAAAIKAVRVLFNQAPYAIIARKSHERSGARAILSAGQVDAVAGFSYYLSAVNLRDRGVPASDLAVLRYADYGCEAYGFAVIVNPAFAAR